MSKLGWIPIFVSVIWFQGSLLRLTFVFPQRRKDVQCIPRLRCISSSWCRGELIMPSNMRFNDSMLTAYATSILQVWMAVQTVFLITSSYTSMARSLQPIQRVSSSTFHSKIRATTLLLEIRRRSRCSIQRKTGPRSLSLDCFRRSMATFFFGCVIFCWKGYRHVGPVVDFIVKF
jgi:hypothetical protein